MGIKIALFRSLKRLLGFVGHLDPSLGFASFLLGQLFSLWFSGLLSPLWITACSELCSQYQHVPNTSMYLGPRTRLHPAFISGSSRSLALALGLSQQICSALETHFVLEHPMLHGALAEPPPNPLICPSTGCCSAPLEINTSPLPEEQPGRVLSRQRPSPVVIFLSSWV